MWSSSRNACLCWWLSIDSPLSHFHSSCIIPVMNRGTGVEWMQSPTRKTSSLPTHSLSRSTSLVNGWSIYSLFLSRRYQLVQVRYYRSDRNRVDRVTLLLPDTTGIVPDDESIKVMETVLKDQLQHKLQSIDDEAIRAAIEEVLVTYGRLMSIDWLIDWWHTCVMQCSHFTPALTLLTPSF